MEKRKEITQKMETVAKKLIRHSFLEGVEKWPPECFGLYYQPHRPEQKELYRSQPCRDTAPTRNLYLPTTTPPRATQRNSS